MAEVIFKQNERLPQCGLNALSAVTTLKLLCHYCPRCTMLEWLNWVKRDKDKGEDDDVAEDLGGRANKTKVKGFEEVETGSRTTDGLMMRIKYKIFTAFAILQTVKWKAVINPLGTMSVSTKYHVNNLLPLHISVRIESANTQSTILCSSFSKCISTDLIWQIKT